MWSNRNSLQASADYSTLSPAVSVIPAAAFPAALKCYFLKLARTMFRCDNGRTYTSLFAMVIANSRSSLVESYAHFITESLTMVRIIKAGVLGGII